MGQNAQTGRLSRGVITLDWMLLTVAAMAVLLLVGTIIPIRIEDETHPVGDMFAMRDNDDLLAFQDFTFDAMGWTPDATSTELAGIGPVLGPFTHEAVRRTFQLPVNAESVWMVFDLHMIGDWDPEDVVYVAIGATEVLALHGAGLEPEITAEFPGLRFEVQQRLVAPQPSDVALPGTTEPFVSHRVNLVLSDPEDTLVLRLRAEAGSGDSWSLDNLTVVTSSRSPR